MCVTKLSCAPPFLLAVWGQPLGVEVGDMISVDRVLSEARTTYSLANSLVWEAEKIAHGIKRRSCGRVPFTETSEVSDFADVMARMRERSASLAEMESRLLAAMHLIARDTAIDDEDPLRLNMIMSRVRTGDSPDEWRRMRKAPRAHFELSVEDQACAAEGVAGLNFETGDDLKVALEIVAGFRALQAARRALLIAERRIKEQVLDLLSVDPPAEQEAAAVAG